VDQPADPSTANTKIKHHHPPNRRWRALLTALATAIMGGGHRRGRTGQPGRRPGCPPPSDNAPEPDTAPSTAVTKTCRTNLNLRRHLEITDR
jgi:hypothetical protein